MGYPIARTGLLVRKIKGLVYLPVVKFHCVVFIIGVFAKRYLERYLSFVGLSLSLECSRSVIWSVIYLSLGRLIIGLFAKRVLLSIIIIVIGRRNIIG